MQPTQNTIDYRKRRRFALALVMIVVLCFIVWLVSSYGFIEVATSGQSGTVVTVDSKDSKNMDAKKSFKKFVRKGSHAIDVTADGTSYFAVVSSPGFFGTAVVKPVLQPEKSRTFVGNSPAPCMLIARTILLSSGCGSSVGELQIHKPASKTTPTYVQRISTALTGYYEGLFTLSDSGYTVIKSDPEYHDQAAHGLYRIQSDFSLRLEKPLDELREDGSYTVKPYGSGFVAISSDYSEIFYYPNVRAQGENIATTNESGNRSAYYANTEGTAIVIAYTEQDNISTNLDEDHSSNEPSFIRIISGQSQKTYNLEKRYAKLIACGTSRLCGLVNNTLSVYDIGDGSAQHLYDIDAVSDIAYIGEDLLIVRDPGVTRFNPVKQEGHSDYSFGKYKYCGLTRANQEYIVCVVGKNASRSALLIHQSGSSEAIDQKIYTLSDTEEIASVSAYRNIVFVSPEYNEEGFVNITPSAAEKQARQTINNKIQALVKQSGIDQRKYQIINPYN